MLDYLLGALLPQGRPNTMQNCTDAASKAPMLPTMSSISEPGTAPSSGLSVGPSSTSSGLNNLMALSPNLPRALERQEWRYSDFALKALLYNGYAAKVYVATCRLSGMDVVLKVYNKVNEAPAVAKQEMYREVAIHSSLQHPQISHMFAAFRDGNNLVLVHEFVPGGDLLALMRVCGGRLSEEQTVRGVLLPLMTAMAYLHRWGIVHRDIKPENVLFESLPPAPHPLDPVQQAAARTALPGKLKLIDFGLAIDMNEERAVSRVGTLDYMAPEVLRCPVKRSCAPAPAPKYGPSVDVWALGIMTYELLTGLPPFTADQRHEVERRIVTFDPKAPATQYIVYPGFMSAAAVDFISHAMSPHPAERPTIQELMSHPWLTQYTTPASVTTVAAATAVPAAVPVACAAQPAQQQQQEAALSGLSVEQMQAMVARLNGAIATRKQQPQQAQQHLHHRDNEKAHAPKTPSPPSAAAAKHPSICEIQPAAAQAQQQQEPAASPFASAHQAATAATTSTTATARSAVQTPTTDNNNNTAPVGGVMAAGELISTPLSSLNRAPVECDPRSQLPSPFGAAYELAAAVLLGADPFTPCTYLLDGQQSGSATTSSSRRGSAAGGQAAAAPRTQPPTCTQQQQQQATTTTAVAAAVNHHLLATPTQSTRCAEAPAAMPLPPLPRAMLVKATQRQLGPALKAALSRAGSRATSQSEAETHQQQEEAELAPQPMQVCSLQQQQQPEPMVTDVIVHAPSSLPASPIRPPANGTTQQAVARMPSPPTTSPPTSPPPTARASLFGGMGPSPRAVQEAQAQQRHAQLRALGLPQQLCMTEGDGHVMLCISRPALCSSPNSSSAAAPTSPHSGACSPTKQVNASPYQRPRLHGQPLSPTHVGRPKRATQLLLGGAHAHAQAQGHGYIHHHVLNSNSASAGQGQRSQVNPLLRTRLLCDDALQHREHHQHQQRLVDDSCCSSSGCASARSGASSTGTDGASSYMSAQDGSCQLNSSREGPLVPHGHHHHAHGDNAGHHHQHCHGHSHAPHAHHHHAHHHHQQLVHKVSSGPMASSVSPCLSATSSMKALALAAQGGAVAAGGYLRGALQLQAADADALGVAAWLQHLAHI